MPSVFEQFNSALEKDNKRAEADAQQSMEQSAPELTPKPDPLRPSTHLNKPEPQQAQPLDEFQQGVANQMNEGQYSKSEAPASANYAENLVESDPNTWNPKYTQMGFFEKAGRSMMRGVGEQIVGGTGDMIQSLAMIMGIGDSDGNEVSRWLQEVGADIADENKNYTTKAFRDQMEAGAWDIKTAMHPDFWSNSVAEGIPLLIEMVLLSKGASGLARQGSKKLLTKFGKKGIKDVVGGGANVGASKLSNFQGGALDMLSGGTSMNMMAGLMNSAELINTHKNDKDADGNPLYTEEELGEMASASFTNNMQYLPIDMLSWGVTYGLASKGMSKAMKGFIGGGAKGAKMHTSQQSLKNAGMTFVNATSPYIKKIGKISQATGKAFTEGIEETYQETFEEWSKMRAKAKIDGTDVPEFFDFYASKENEATKAVSMALGMLGGGSSEAMNMIRGTNEAAERAYKMYDKTELLKKAIKNDDQEMIEAQKGAIHDMLINNKEDGSVSNEEFIKGLVKKEIVSEEEAGELNRMAASLDENYEKGRRLGLNVNGRVAYANSLMKQEHFEEHLERKQKEYNQTKADIAQSNSSPEKKKQKARLAEQAYLEKVNITGEAIANQTMIQDALLSKGHGLKFDPKQSAWVKDEKGNETLINGLNQDQVDAYYNKSDEEIFADIKKSRQTSLFDKIKSAVTNPELRKTYKTTLENVKQKFGNLEEEVNKEDAENKKKKDAETKDGTTATPPPADENGKTTITPAEGETINVEEDETAPEKTIGFIEVASEEQLAEIEAKNPELSPEHKEAIAKRRETLQSETDEKGQTTNEDGTKSSPNPDQNESVEKKEQADTKAPPRMQDSEKRSIGIDKAYHSVKSIAKKVFSKIRTIGSTSNSPEPKIITKDIEKIDQIIKEGIRLKNSTKQIIKDVTEKTRMRLKDYKAIEKHIDDIVAKVDKNVTAFAEGFEDGKKFGEGKKAMSTKAKKLIHRNKIVDQPTMDQWVQQNVGIVQNGMKYMNKAVALNSQLQKMYPGTNLNVEAIKGLEHAVSFNTIGYTLGSTIYIDESTWNQDEIFHHEFAHIFYASNPDSPDVNAIIDKALKNKPLVDKVMRTHAEYLLHEVTEPFTAEGVYFEKGDKIQVKFEGKTKELPLKDQSIIKEELFVHYLQGPLSKQFSLFFKPTGESLRQRNVKKYYADLKGRINPHDANYIMNELAEDPDALKSFENIKKAYGKAVTGKNISAVGRAAKYDDYQAENYDRILQTREAWKNERNPVDEVEQIPDADKTNISNDQEETAGEQNNDLYPEGDENGFFYDKSWKRAQVKASKLINNFIKEFNLDQYKKKKASAEQKGIPLEYKFVEMEDFKTLLTSSAKDVSNPFVWMDIILNPAPDQVLMNAFVEHLKGRNDKYSILRSMHSVFNNTYTMPVMIGNILENGQIVFDQALSYQEQNQVNHIEESFDPYSDTMQEHYNAIANGLYDNKTYYQQILKDIVGYYPNIRMNKIIEEDRINFKNGVVDLKTFFDHYFKNGVPQGDPDLDFDQSLTDRESSDIQEMITNIVTTSRKHSSNSVVRGPEKDANGFYKSAMSKHLSSALFKTFDGLQNDLASGMSKQDFVKKYSYMKSPSMGNFQGGIIRNKFIENIYDQYKRDGSMPSITAYVGEHNQVTKKENNYNRSDAQTLYISDMARFMSNPNEAMYLTTLNSFGDSKRSFMTNMQKYDYENDRVSGLRNAYKIYIASESATGNDPKIKSLAEYTRLYNKEVADRVDFLNKNYNIFSQYPAFRSLYNEKTQKVTVKGKKVIGSYELSKVVNHSNVHALITPSIPISDINKRNKMNISPAMMLSPKMRIENVMMPKEVLKSINEELKETEWETNDSGQYITDVTAEKIRATGAGVVEYNNGFKLVNYKVEENNPRFKGKANALKGYTTIITKEQADKFPKLKVIYDILNERQAKFDAWAKEKGVKTSDTYNDVGTDMDYIALASPFSSEKGSMFPQSLIKSFNENFTVDSLVDPNAKDEYMKMLDVINYHNKNFVGFDGSNLGPQMRMDMQRDKAKLPIQFRSGFLVAASNMGKLAEGESILRDLTRANEANLRKNLLNDIYDDQGRVVEDEKLAQYILEHSDPESLSAIDKELLSMPGASIHNPRLSQTAKNQIKNRIIRYGNNIEEKGTIAQQKSELAGHVVPGTTEARPLSFYRKRGGNNTSMHPMEFIAPSYMESNSRKREYFSNRGEAYTKLNGSNKLKGEFDIFNQDDLNKFIDEHTIIDTNGKKRFYIPGEKVLLTRVPSSGPSFTGVGEIVEYDTTGASNVMIPTEFKNAIGSDDDGDQLFINRKAWKGAVDYNSFFDKAVKFWLQGDMNKILSTALSSSTEVDKIIEQIQEQTGQGQSDALPFSSNWSAKNHNDALGANQTVGIAFNDHRLYNSLAAYKTQLLNGKQQPLNIVLDGVVRNKFEDYGSGNQSRIHRSNTITQIVLDSAKNSQADDLNFNKYTIGYAMALTNLGFDLKEVGLFLNQPIVKRYVELVSTRGNSYSKNVSANMALNTLALELNMPGKKGFNRFNMPEIISYDSNNKSKENQYKAIELLNALNNIASDMQVVNKITQGHKNISSDPYITRKQTEDFNRLVSNKENAYLDVTEDFSKSPEVQLYRNSLETTTKTLGAMSIEFSKSNEPVYREVIRSIQGQVSEDYAAKRVSDLIKIHNEGKFISTNKDFSKAEMMRLISNGFNPDTQKYTPGSLLHAYQEEVFKLKTQNMIIDEETGNVASDFEKNAFLSRGVVVDHDGTKLTLRTQSQVKSDSFPQEEIAEIRKGFMELPQDLQDKFIVADLIVNGWKGNNSILPFFDLKTIQAINKGAAEVYKSEATTDLNDLKNAMLNTLMNTNRGIFQDASIKMNNEKLSKRHITDFTDMFLKKAYLSGRDLLLLKNTDNLNPSRYFKINRYDQNNKYIKDGNFYLKINGLTDSDYNYIRETSNPSSYANSGSAMVRRFKQIALSKGWVEIVSPDPKNHYDVDILAIEDSGPSRAIKKKDLTRVGRAAKEDFHNYTSDRKLDFEEFIDAYELKYAINESQRLTAYNNYLRHKEEANILSVKWNDKYISNLSDDALLKAYEDFGNKDVYAYSNIIVPIVLELTKRAAGEQVARAKKHGHTIAEGTQDISVLKAWLQTNNIDSTHPATQAAQYELETQYKKFQEQKKHYAKRINKATDDLYNEKFNDKISSNAFINKIARAIHIFFRNRKNVYKQLYGNIIDTVKHDEDSEFLRHKLKPEAELKRLLHHGKISEAEYNFAKVFRETTTELAQVKGTKDANTNGFIPAVAMTRMETFAHRGLLGLLANSRSENEAISDVKIYQNGVLTPFSDVENYYRLHAGNGFKTTKEYLQYKLKAKALLKKGKNEDGSMLLINDMTTKTMLGDGMLKRFTTEAYMKEEDMMSMDLNKALHDFVHASLFTNGNGEFKGFVKLQAIVDGLLIHNQKKGFVNQNKFVREVMKQGFLGQLDRKKEGLGDKVINSLVRGNLLYILGYKGLILKKGMYAVGNMIVGKYHNIKNHGGRAWINGEKRYWGLSGGNWGTAKSSGVLKSLNFMDINVYDEVSLDRSTGLDAVFTDIALQPMIQSEKWIQRVHFLGLLSEEQWNRFDQDGNYKIGAKKLTAEEVAELEDKVKTAHGKGYQATDQRLIQRYSWGRMVMQYARFIPTMFYDRFSKEDINIYGKEHVGSLRMVGNAIHAMVNGEMSTEQFLKYRKSLSPAKRQILDSGLRGMAMTTVAAFMGSAFNLNTANELTGDANYLINADKLEYKVMPSLVRTIHNLFTR